MGTYTVTFTIDAGGHVDEARLLRSLRSQIGDICDGSGSGVLVQGSMLIARVVPDDDVEDDDVEDDEVPIPNWGMFSVEGNLAVEDAMGALREGARRERITSADELNAEYMKARAGLNTAGFGECYDTDVRERMVAVMDEIADGMGWSRLDWGWT